MDYIAVHLFVSDPVVSDLLTGLLEKCGFTGFEQQEDRLVAYIPAEDFTGEQSVRSLLASHQVDFRVEAVMDRNWNAEWEASFAPVIVGDFCGIRAAFHAPLREVTHEIIITPRMTFGTGHHPTTASMVKLMSGLDLAGKSVLDFGTGTGILAILAVRMGAARVTGLDVDPAAVQNARENALENALRPGAEAAGSAPSLSFFCADSPSAAPGPFDCIMANIHLKVITDCLEALLQSLRPGGLLLAAGILEKDMAAMQAAAEEAGLMPKMKMTAQGWASFLWQKTG
jgi:ribosomal protein L11 methyltransferase